MREVRDAKRVPEWGIHIKFPKEKKKVEPEQKKKKGIKPKKNTKAFLVLSGLALTGRRSCGQQ